MIGIVDYGVGNLRSIHNMLQRSGIDSVVTSQDSVLRDAKKLILPGVGHFNYGMNSLRERGLIEVLNERALEAGVPILGICLGAQLIGRRSEEGPAPGLGWVPMDTVAFDRKRLIERKKVPHMGWAETRHTNHSLFDELEAEPRFYYVHSFHFRCDDPNMVICEAEHGYRFASGVACGNILGVQFHPEKSHLHGKHILTNFASMTFS